MTPLSEPEIQALSDALDDEYKSYATYAQVIADFGPERPFVNCQIASNRDPCFACKSDPL